MSDNTIGIIGCGKMGGIILEGIVRGGFARKVCFYEPNAAACQKIAQRYQDKATASTTDEISKIADVIILCVKPHIIMDVLREVHLHGERKDRIIVSIAAGISLLHMQSQYPQSRFVRVMPNTPCQVGEGLSVISCQDEQIPKETMSMITAIFNTMGRTMRLPEEQMNAATALSGSGPGLILCIIEALADGALYCGIPKCLAIEMAAQTMLGTAKVVLESGEHPAVLRDQVCTPGGCTIAGITSLEESGIRGAIIRCIERTRDAAKHLG